MNSSIVNLVYTVPLESIWYYGLNFKVMVSFIESRGLKAHCTWDLGLVLSHMSNRLVKKLKKILDKNNENYKNNKYN